MDGSDKKNFLRGRSPATLYLWQKAEEFDLLDAITQQLDDSVGIDLSSSDECEYIGKRTFRSEEESVLKLNRSIEKANEIAEKSLLLSEEKLKHDKIQTCLKKVSNLETHLMTTEEKLCMVDDKTNALAHLYTTRIETLTAKIDEQNYFLKELM